MGAGPPQSQRFESDFIKSVCEKVDALPSRDREGAVDVVDAGPLPYGRGSERTSHTRSKTHGPSGPPRVGRRRRWLCIAYAFAPINRSGTYRSLGFVKHLDRLGWDATVITVEPGAEPVDEDLLRQVPSSARIIRTSWTPLVQRLKEVLGVSGMGPRTASSSLRDTLPSRAASFSLRETWHLEGATLSGKQGSVPPLTTGVSRKLELAARECGVDHRRLLPYGRGTECRRSRAREWVSRLLMTPDSRIGWIAPAVSAAMRAVRDSRPDIIYSTAPYMSAHLIAMIVGFRTGIPWVADFRDPWRDNPFRDLGFKSLERWDAWLERRVLRRAAHVICNTSSYERRLRERFSFLVDKCSTILNGFDSEVFRALKPVTIAGPGDFVFAHCGQFYGSRSPMPWLTALRRVCDQSPGPMRKPQLLLIGPDHFERRSLVELARSVGVGDCVRVLGSMSHAKALAHLAGSDVLLLAGSPAPGGDLQVPGKLFEYLALQKPILAGLAPSNPAVDILREAGAPACICSPDDPNAMAREMLAMTSRCHNVGLDAVTPDPPPALAQFDRAHRAAELAALFNRLVADHTRHPARILKCASRPASRITSYRAIPRSVGKPVESADFRGKLI